MRGRAAAWLTPGRWPWIAGLFSAAMLAAAHAFQATGYAPCALCLRQREVYWAVLGLVAVWAVITLVARRISVSRIVVWGLAAAFLFGAGLAFFHAGVEWKWWPGPASCSGAQVGPVALDDLSGVLAGTAAVRAPACDEAPWYVLGLSMAGWNGVLSLLMAVLSAVAATRRPVHA